MIKQIFSINNTLNLYYVIRFYFFVKIFIYLIHNPLFVRAMENLCKKKIYSSDSRRAIAR